MSHDIEQIRAAQKFNEQMRSACVSELGQEFVRHNDALLAAIDELTQRVTWMTTDSEGNVIDFAADLDVAVRALNAAELDNVLKQARIDELTAQRDKVLALHTSDDKGLCDECFKIRPARQSGC